MFKIDKRILNYLVIIVLTFFSFWWTSWIFHKPIPLYPLLVVMFVRVAASTILFRDYSLSWSKATPKSFLIKSAVYLAAFIVYMPFFYQKIRISFFVSELFTYLFVINLLMYGYAYYFRRSKTDKTKKAVIYGTGKAAMKLEEEFQNTPYKVIYFVDDNKALDGRSIDGIPIVSKEKLIHKLGGKQLDLLVMSIPSASQEYLKNIYNELNAYFRKIQILPSLNDMLVDKPYAIQLKDLSVADLLARRPQDLDTKTIADFVQGKKVLITGAGGSIGSEIAKQCEKFGAASLTLVDSSEFNLYQIGEQLSKVDLKLLNVTDRQELEKLFAEVKPDIVIHAAAYKHVPICEYNQEIAVKNNVLGTKNVIDVSIAYRVKKVVIISTDKAVRPTNVMGATKRVTELYAQNVEAGETEIVAVRFGNVLGSSGSVIPKFKAQIEAGGPVTVTHPEITRYFMLIPEACQLVLQAAAIAKGGELFILDMGEPVKIADLAKQMIRLYGKEGEVKIVYIGLRPGEKLHEELLIDENEQKTKYSSIYITCPTRYDIAQLNQDIEVLLNADDKIAALQKIVPEFTREDLI
ncbi:MAG: polysaccharide biosynthesis protein [Sulfurovum sp.]|nr:MAG: polysaccharide biosynthesis protein [Sulfurovum sp.]